MIYIRINEAMQEKGLSVDEIALRGGLAEKVVRALMEQPTTTCNLVTLDRLSKALGVPAEHLITSVPDPTPTSVAVSPETTGAQS